MDNVNNLPLAILRLDNYARSVIVNLNVFDEYYKTLIKRVDGDNDVQKKIYGRAQASRKFIDIVMDRPNNVAPRGIVQLVMDDSTDEQYTKCMKYILNEINIEFNLKRTLSSYLNKQSNIIEDESIYLLEYLSEFRELRACAFNIFFPWLEEDETKDDS